MVGEPSGYKEFSLSANDYQIKDLDGHHIIEMRGFYELKDPGNPILPVKYYNILLPTNCNLSTVKITIVSVEGGYINKSLNIPPAPPFVADVGNKTIFDYGRGKKIVDGYNVNVYNNDSLYPSTPVAIVKKGELREAKLITVRFTPIQYNPVKKQAYLNKKVIFKVSYELTTPPTLPSAKSEAEEYLITPYTLKLLKNYDILNTKDFDKIVAPSDLKPSETKYDYVIITTNEIKKNSKALNEFINFLKYRGFNPLIITEDDYGYENGIERVLNIRNWLREHYQTYGIKYVLLIGDPNPNPSIDEYCDSIPMLMCYPRLGATYYEECPTDYIYADLTGDWDSNKNGYYGDPEDNVDFDPEVFVGRIPVYNHDYTTLDSILEKIMKYENTYGDWRKRVLMPVAIANYENESGYQIERTDGRDLPKYVVEDILKPNGFSWFVMYEREGLSPVPETAPYYNAPLNKENVINEWNKGYGIVFWWGHGSEYKAYRKYWSFDDGDNIPESDEMEWESFISSFDTSELCDDKPAITYQCSCLNGYPEDSDNLGYALLRRGAVATVSASRVSWYQVGYWEPDGTADNAEIGYEYVKRVVSGLPLGEALYLAKSLLNPTSDSAWKMNLMDFNLYGDPSLSLYGNVTINQTFVIDKLPYIIASPGYYILNTSCTDLDKTAIRIDADNVVLDGNGMVLDGDYADWTYGVYVEDHKNITIKNLTVREFCCGIHLSYSFNSVITDCNILNCSWDGIYLGDSSNNIITNCGISNCDYGISLEYSSNNMITDCNILDCDWDGICFEDSFDNNIINNVFVNCGLDIWDSYNNMVINNTVNGKPLIYLENEKDKIIDNAGQVILINCSNITVKDLSLSNIPTGIKFIKTSNSKIINCNISDCWEGIFLDYSSYNIITNVNALNNEFGIFLIDLSNNNIIYLNNLINNDYSIGLYDSYNNILHSPEPINYTYNGKIFTNYLGNYYSDYDGVDDNGDGVGDTPYVIDSYNADEYPLIAPVEYYIINPINESTSFSIILPNATLLINKVVKLPIVLNTTEALSYLQFKIVFDPGVVRIVNVTSSVNITLLDIGDGYIEVGLESDEGIESGEIVEVDVVGASGGVTELNGDVIKAIDINGNEGYGVVIPGAIEVISTKTFDVILPNSTIRINKTTTLPIMLNTTEPLGSLQFRIYYNPDIINITNVTSNVGMIQANIGYGFVEVGIISVNGFGSGEVAEITVAGLSNGTTILDGELIDASDVEGNYKYGIIVPGVLNVYKRKPGDANGDDKITAVDALIYLRFAVGLDITPYKLDPVADDMTGDGKITATDALKVLRIAVGLE